MTNKNFKKNSFSRRSLGKGVGPFSLASLGYSLHRARARGFTLMETLVAVLILSLSIVGPLTIASKGMQAALVAKDQTTAYYLAQDAVEYVRWVRDSDALYNSAHPGSLTWLAGFDGTSNPHTNNGGSTGTCVSPNLCYVDTVADKITQCPGGVCPLLSYDTSNYYFTYPPNGTQTIYNRSVQLVTPIGANSNEAQVIVKVTWQDTAGPAHTITVYENLYQWQ